MKEIIITENKSGLKGRLFGLWFFIISIPVGGNYGDVHAFNVGVKSEKDCKHLFQINDYQEVKDYANEVSSLSNLPIIDEV